MKIISWNVNGIRAVSKKGFNEWLSKERPDILCLQEIRAKQEQIPEDILNIKGYYKYFNSAEKLGYAGTAVFSKQKPIDVKTEIGFDKIDKEGRAQILKFNKFTLINLYMINGGKGSGDMRDKLASYDFVREYLEKHGAEEGSRFVLTGDFNIAHKEIDLARPKQNQKNHGFTLEEREKINELISIGFIDSFRYFYPNKQGAYTWWSHFSNARKRNIGWRIDYVFASKNLIGKIKDAFILQNARGSDHCPVGIKLN